MPDNDPLHDAYHLLASGKVPNRRDEGRAHQPAFDRADPRFVVRTRRMTFTLIPAGFVARILSIFIA
ncbi:MAG: hypothetical protein IT320_24170 [Anaerolineae bacterium]|nr:hypothetical protein [Anaerolineae bacterium]